MNMVRYWFFSFVFVSIAIAICYFFVDRPLALFVHTAIGNHVSFVRLSHIPDPLIPLSVVVFISLGFWRLLGKKLSKVQATALVCSISVVMAEATKNQLKFIFGRTWPETWVANNPSFIHGGVYGFNLLHGGVGYASFPSGHMAVTGAIISVLWLSYPKLRLAYGLLAVLVAVGLVGANYHFVSDIIAGAFVGASIGWMCKLCSPPGE